MKTFYTVFPMCENIHLVKDVGMIPYMFHKKHGYKSVILTYKNGEYPYLDKEVEGLKLRFLKKITGFATIDVIIFLLFNARKIDVLNCFHFMRSTLLIILAFRFFSLFDKRRKVYLKLDAGPNINELIVKKYFERKTIKLINLISIENLLFLKRLHNEPDYNSANLIYLPNGYIKCVNDKTLFSEKHNIILTVGRIGSDQKANDILLKAFEKLDDKYKNWSLYFVGPIQNDFDCYTNKFILDNPKLHNRVVFTGPVYEREELDELYKKSKLFVLSSDYEGFPLVFLEALKNGCTIVSTNFPSSYDVVEKQKLDSLFNPRDINQLSLLLSNYMDNEFELKQNCINNQEFASDNFNWERLINKLNEQLFKD